MSHVFDQYDQARALLLAVSKAFDFPADYLPENVRYVGPLLDEPGWSKPWTSPWPKHSDLPRVLVSFSTAFQDQGDVLQRVLNALGVGRNRRGRDDRTGDAGRSLHAPKNVILLDSAPHDEAMKEATLVVTHGGHGTLSRALRHRLPLLVMPMGRDQNDNASRVEMLGAGLSLPPACAETEIVLALKRLLSEPHFRIAAHQVGRRSRPTWRTCPLVHEMEAIVIVGQRTFGARTQTLRPDLIRQSRSPRGLKREGKSKNELSFAACDSYAAAWRAERCFGFWIKIVRSISPLARKSKEQRHRCLAQGPRYGAAAPS